MNFVQFRGDEVKRGHTVDYAPSSLSDRGLKTADIVKKGLVKSSRSMIGEVRANVPTLDEKVFKALANAKVWTSQVAMYLDRSTRDRFFKQLDLLHDCDEWFDDEQPLVLDTYKGFLRFMLTAGRGSKPSLGMSPNGYLVAVWQRGSDRLTIEFRPKDTAEWIVSRELDGSTERAAGRTFVARLSAVLAPYEPAALFAGG